MNSVIAAPTERPILFSDPMVRAILEGRKTQTRRIVKPMRGQEAWNNTGLIDKVRRFANSEGTDWWTMAVGEPGPLTSLGGDPGHVGSVRCPYGMPGDRLWVREAWSLEACGDPYYEITYRANREHREIKAKNEEENNLLTRLYDTQQGDWRPSIHMPRWASRLALEVVRVRVERLQAITDADAQAEGATPRTGCYGYELQSPGWSMDWSPVGQPGFGGRILTERDICLSSPRMAFANLWNSITGPDAWGDNPWVWVVEFKQVGQANSEIQPKGEEGK